MDKIFTHNFRTHKSTLQKVRNLLKIILCKKNKNHKSQFIRNITLRVLVHYYQALVKTTLPGCNSRGMQQMLNSLECAVKSSWGESIINGRSCVKKKPDKMADQTCTWAHLRQCWTFPKVYSMESTNKRAVKSHEMWSHL